MASRALRIFYIMYPMCVAQSAVRGTVKLESPLGVRDWSVILTW